MKTPVVINCSGYGIQGIDWPAATQYDGRRDQRGQRRPPQPQQHQDRDDDLGADRNRENVHARADGARRSRDGGGRPGRKRESGWPAAAGTAAPRPGCPPAAGTAGATRLNSASASAHGRFSDVGARAPQAHLQGAPEHVGGLREPGPPLLLPRARHQHGEDLVRVLAAVGPRIAGQQPPVAPFQARRLRHAAPPARPEPAASAAAALACSRAASAASVSEPLGVSR